MSHRTADLRQGNPGGWRKEGQHGGYHRLHQGKTTERKWRLVFIRSRKKTQSTDILRHIPKGQVRRRCPPLHTSRPIHHSHHPCFVDALDVSFCISLYWFIVAKTTGGGWGPPFISTCLVQSIHSRFSNAERDIWQETERVHKRWNGQLIILGERSSVQIES